MKAKNMDLQEQGVMSLKSTANSNRMNFSHNPNQSEGTTTLKGEDEKQEDEKVITEQNKDTDK